VVNNVIKKRKIPKFHRQRAHAFKRIAEKGWRRPRGKDSLQRRKVKSRGSRPTIGYCQPKEIRYLHPCGLREVLVYNAKDVAVLEPKSCAIRIAHGVGKLKRAEILKKADEMKIRILNR
jgi:large subunit ribosomal protein L32e